MTRLLRSVPARLLFPLVAGLLAACQAGGPADVLSLRSSETPTDVTVTIARAAQKCWFGARERSFSGYRLANEVNSPGGRPRLLLVPRRDPTALPLLVIQAERDGGASGETHLQVYGPLLSSGEGRRIHDDVRRWAGGNDKC